MGTREDVLKVLEEGVPITAHDIGVKTDSGSKNVARILSHMRSLGTAHVDSWIRTRPSGPPIGLWVLGPGEDAPHPQPNFLRGLGIQKCTNYEAKVVRKTKRGWNELVNNIRGRSVTSIALYGKTRPAKPVKLPAP